MAQVTTFIDSNSALLVYSFKFQRISSELFTACVLIFFTCGFFLISEFDVRFNPDIHAPGTKHAPSEVTLIKLVLVLIKVACELSVDESFVNINGVQYDLVSTVGEHTSIFCSTFIGGCVIL